MACGRPIIMGCREYLSDVAEQFATKFGTTAT